ncbi:MAG: M20/M25/M40 family metallo-hydrolase [Inquilinus sp.]|uniref:M20/M25/M40 family metallo-hydrolase n=1 Tax=Inquilinus sp. TaxID=1932117 RepID=UPI003F351F70
MAFVCRAAMLAAAIGVGLSGPALAQDTAAQAKAEIQRVRDSAGFKAAVQHIDQGYDGYIAEGIKLVEIPAPPFKEEVRAKAFAELLRGAGLADVEIDEEGNVLGLRQGTGGGDRVVVVSAHLDTVFPEGTDVKVRREGTRLMAPGVSDDTFSLAAILAYIRAMDAAGIKHKANILFVGTVGEEGLGDLRGVRHLFTKGEYKDRIDAFFSIEGGSADQFTSSGVGSKRYRVTYKGPGGHSFGAFGLVNPAYAMAEAITQLSRTQVPSDPKVTYNVGVVKGGTSVNSIPVETSIEVDMRSGNSDGLDRVEQRLLAVVDQAAQTENAARSTKEGEIMVEKTVIGDRPAGAIAETELLFQLAKASIQAAGYEFKGPREASNDSNIPWSLGIPAVTLGKNGPGQSGRSHSLDEWMEIDKAPMMQGMATSLATILATAKME